MYRGGWVRLRRGIFIPVKKGADHQSRPREASPLFAFHVFSNLHLALVNLGQGFRRLQLGHVGAELAQQDPLHPGLNCRVDDGLVRGDLVDGRQVDNRVLVLERGDELVKGIGVGDAVDFDVGGEGGFGGGAGEDFDVACEAGVGVEGGEDGGTEVAGGLRFVGRVKSGGVGGVRLTPMTMMFLRIVAMTGLEVMSRAESQMRVGRNFQSPCAKKEKRIERRWHR